MGWFSDIGGGLLQGVGSIVGSVFNANSQKDVNQQQISLSREQTELARQDANTAHQREVKDLMAAGLNPNLSAGGNGAATIKGDTPGLSAPQVSVPNVLSYFKELQDLDLREKQVQQQDRSLDIQDKATTAGIAKSLSETDLNKFKKLLMQKGMIRAELEGEASSVIKKGIEFLKKQMNHNSLNPRETDLYEGAIPKNTQDGSMMGLP